MGVILLASGIEGYLVGIGRLALATRAIVFVCGVMIFLPLLAFEIIGAALFIGFILITLVLHRGSAKQNEISEYQEPRNF